jgi:hypothetical protein
MGRVLARLVNLGELMPAKFWSTLVVMGLLALGACADGAAPDDEADASTSFDAPPLPDAIVFYDAAPDAPPPDAMLPPADTCQTCDIDSQCGAGGKCLAGTPNLCVPTCDLASPTCPAGFTCTDQGGQGLCIPDVRCCLDNDQDGYGEGAQCLGADCDDGSGTVNPGAQELCNGIDDDCNGNVPADETDMDMDGVRVCAGDCKDDDDTIYPGATEACDGVDQDCDGMPDDGFVLNVGCDGADGDLCNEGVTVCKADGTGTECTDVSPDSKDVCDGVDNDCDAASPDGSEDALPLGMGCDGGDGDLCVEGQIVCAGNMGLQCSDSTGTTVDVCDGVDNDCDPASGDGQEDPQLNQMCDGPDSDLCIEGSFSFCSGAGGLVCSDNTPGNAEVCNGVDDDCNPGTADGSAEAGFMQACDGADSDMCIEGIRVCQGGPGLTCTDMSPGTTELCNAQDDDCDGVTDNGTAQNDCALQCQGNVTGVTCGAGGTCAITSCAGGFFNIDGGCGNGCECQTTGQSASCAGPTSLGTVNLGQVATTSGNLVPAGQEAWYQVTFTGNTSTAYHPRVVFTNNPGNAFQFDIRTNCAGGAPACGSEGGVASALTDWEVLYTGGDPSSAFNPIPPVGQNGTILIHVYRKAGAPVTCAQYTLQISN